MLASVEPVTGGAKGPSLIRRSATNVVYVGFIALTEPLSFLMMGITSLTFITARDVAFVPKYAQGKP